MPYPIRSIRYINWNSFSWMTFTPNGQQALRYLDVAQLAEPGGEMTTQYFYCSLDDTGLTKLESIVSQQLWNEATAVINILFPLIPMRKWCGMNRFIKTNYNIEHRQTRMNFLALKLIRRNNALDGILCAQQSAAWYEWLYGYRFLNSCS